MVHSLSRRKIDEKSAKCIFIEYSTQSKAYKLYNPVSGKMIISKDVIFDETANWDWVEEHIHQGVLMEDSSFEKSDSDHASVITSSPTGSPTSSSKFSNKVIRKFV